MATTLADGIFKSIFLNENNRIMIQISVKFVPRSPIDNKPALVQAMAWCRTGDKPLHEPMMTQFTDALRTYAARSGDESNIWDMDLTTTMYTDDLAPNSAKPSMGTMTTSYCQTHFFLQCFIQENLFALDVCHE